MLKPGGTGWPMSRVLSPAAVARRRVAIIHLGAPLPGPQAAYPDTRASSPRSCPVWPCSGWGLPSRPGRRARGGLLHRRFTLTRCCTRQPWRSIFCGTCLRVSPSGRYPPPCPAEPGLSSADGSSQTRPTRSPSQPVPPSGYGLLPAARICSARVGFPA